MVERVEDLGGDPGLDGDFDVLAIRLAREFIRRELAADGDQAGLRRQSAIDDEAVLPHVEPGEGAGRIVRVGGRHGSAAKTEAGGIGRAVRPVPDIKAGLVEDVGDAGIGGDEAGMGGEMHGQAARKDFAAHG